MEAGSEIDDASKMFLQDAFRETTSKALGVIQQARGFPSALTFGGKTIDRLKKLTPGEFQVVVAVLLRAFGATDVTVSPPGPDRGIDGEGRLIRLDRKVAFQAK